MHFLNFYSVLSVVIYQTYSDIATHERNLSLETTTMSTAEPSPEPTRTEDSASDGQMSRMERFKALQRRQVRPA